MEHRNNSAQTFSERLRILPVILAAAFCLAGCGSTKAETSAASAVSAPAAQPAASSSSSSVQAPPQSSSRAVSSVPAQSSSKSSSAAQTEPHFSFSYDDPEVPPESANIEICSLAHALGSFSEIASKRAEGSPEEIVKTLLERNILCFAAMQGKGWYTEGSSDRVRIESDYFRSADQMSELFYSTYTDDQAWRLLHPQEAGGYGDVFTDGEDGDGLYFDLNHLRRYHGDSFTYPTFAAIISASDGEITFGRFYDSAPAPNSVQPNNMYFRALYQNGEWVLENYITDAEGYIEQGPFVTTGRLGAPDLMELAKKQVGNIGGRKYWEWYGFGEHMEWCAAFTSWLYGQADKDEPMFTGCYTGQEWFVEREQWGEPSCVDIAPADCIFFDWNDDGDADHVGLVVGTDGAYVYTIEGNRDDVCIQRSYPLDYKYICGYGLMDWSGGNDSQAEEPPQTEE